jgi:hypothetical protein
VSGHAGSQALLITPAFFGYEKDIVAELERQGYATTFLDERPSNSAVARAIMRVRKSLISRRIEAYYRMKQTALVDTRFDLVVVIKAEVVPRWFLEDLRRRNADARFVLYTFDAIGNARNCLEVLDCFDSRLSFDRNDVAEHPEFTYLPLFYTPDFTPLPVPPAERRHSISFIGTLHTDRYAFAQKMFTGRDRAFGYFFVQARWYFAIIKYLTREHAHVPWKDVSFASLSRTSVAEIFRNSHAVLDMQRAGQTGLTMRTFEVLASGTVLVTTNSAIEHEPFFDPSRVVIVPDDPKALDAAAVGAAIDALPAPAKAPEGFAAYSLEAWTRVLTAGRPDST